MDNIDCLQKYNICLTQVETKYSLTDILTENKKYDQNSYWDRIGRLSAFEKNMEENQYHFLYEIQGLSSQIHFGVKNCLFFYSLRSKKIGDPNQYNHRYGFFVEATVHALYAYWNRVAGMINFSFSEPAPKSKIYFNKQLIDKIKTEFLGIELTKPFEYIVENLSKLHSLNRNEMAHNNSFIMQEFLPSHYSNEGLNFHEINELLIYFNNTIARDIDILCDFLEYLENNQLKKSI